MPVLDALVAATALVEQIPVVTQGQDHGVRELRQHANRYLARVAMGETTEVTDGGRPVALLVPTGEDRWRDLVASGQVLAATGEGDVVDIPNPDSALADGTPASAGHERWFPVARQKRAGEPSGDCQDPVGHRRVQQRAAMLSPGSSTTWPPWRRVLASTTSTNSRPQR
ncbi:MAG: type II toxin-antitoxin system Phd/YefM family antitoxin [Acidimicrobiales bacterium]